MAKELRKPEKGSFKKKLLRILTAAIIALPAGWQAKDAIAPEKSEAFKAYEKIYSARGDLDVLRKIVGQYEAKEIKNQLVSSLKEKGGVSPSDDLKDEVLKDEMFMVETHQMASQEAREGKRPYYLNPKNVLGKEFLESQPEIAMGYMKKIEDTIKATVYIENYSVSGKKVNANGSGSGVIVNTNKGPMILTNNHVIDGSMLIGIELSNGEARFARVINRDKEKDIALLEIVEKDEQGKGRNKLFQTYLEKKKIKPLEIETKIDLMQDEKLALIGNPLGFPNEVSISEAKNVVLPNDDLMEIEGELVKRKAHHLISKPDPRFAKLAKFIRGNFKDYYVKGQSIPGMSGGPIIRLEENQLKLIGINCMQYNTDASEPGKDTMVKGPDINMGMGVMGKDLQEFIDLSLMKKK